MRFVVAVADKRKEVRGRISPELKDRFKWACLYLDISENTAVEDAIVQWLEAHKAEIEAAKKKRI